MLNLLARSRETTDESYTPSPRYKQAPSKAAAKTASQKLAKKIRRARQQQDMQERAALKRGNARQAAAEEVEVETVVVVMAPTLASSAAPAADRQTTVDKGWISAIRPASSRTKRLFDLIGASCCLVALAPVMLSLAFLVKRDGGPAIFGHRRIGTDGKPFSCLKFRSMCVDAEERLQEHLESNAEARAEWERDFKLRDDPRVTALGRLLRRTSLDELPQLLNVIRGEMSLVGPRPIIADEVSRYGDYFNAYRDCRPGITGLWQISGRNDVSYKTRIRLDSFYATRWTLMKDVAILLRTVTVVLRRSGAY